MAVTIKKSAPKSKTSAVVYDGPAGADKVASQYRRVVKEIDELEARKKMLRDELFTYVQPRQLEKLKAGVAETTITIPTENDTKVMVIFQERYEKSLKKEDNQAAFVQAFGDNYKLFVEEREAISLNASVTLDSLKKACGDKWAAVAELLTIDEYLVPRSGALGNVAKAYSEGETELANDLMTFVQSCMVSPQVRT